MEILPSNRKGTELIFNEDDERCVAVAMTYGSADNLFLQVTNGQLSAETPSMVLCMATYGENTIRRQIAGRMKMAAMRMGETSIDLADAETIAESISQDSNARILGYDMVMRFFRWLEIGKYELYACKPRNIMEAWQQYAKTAINEQIRLKSELQSEKRKAEQEQHDKSYLRPEEFKAWKKKWTQSNK